MPFHVSSESGRLRQVIMHRPGSEFEQRAAPRTQNWLHTAQIQHDLLAGLLMERDVQVHLFSDLLVEVLDLVDAREWIFDRALPEELFGSALSAAVRCCWTQTDSRRLAEILITGVRKRDVQHDRPGGLRWELLRDEDYVFMPLMDQWLQRNHSVFIYGGVSLATSASRTRAREYLHEAVYRFHPMFADQGVPVWYGSDGERRSALLTGSDIQVLGRGCVMAAVGGRSTVEGIQRLARNLFLDGGAGRLLVVELPGTAARKGLDAAVSMVDHDVVLLSDAVIERMRSWTVRPARWTDDPENLEIVVNDDFLTGLGDMLGRDRLVALTVTEESGSIGRKAGDPTGSAYPFLALEPGVVISDTANRAVNACLRRHGVEVVTVAFSDFGYERGGPRAITCAIERDAA